MNNQQETLVGAHISAAGGVHNALINGKKIGATTIQLFTANQRQWHTNLISKQEVELWHEYLQKTKLKKIASHAGYLINLGSPNEENLEKSKQSFKKEIQRCTQLAISYLIFHPGSALKEPIDQCLERIVESIKMMGECLQNSNTRLLIETTAGQGSNLGYSFEQIAYIIQKTEKYVPIGTCIDTGHIFAAGYDIRTKQSWDKTLKEFDKTVGLQHLHAFHLNDSMKPLGSKRDRHAPLGKGEIGIECFQTLMTNPTTKQIPKYLETPGGLPLWEKEIALLKSFTK